MNSPEQSFEDLCDLIRAELSISYLDKYLYLLKGLADDVTDFEGRFLGMRNAPASRSRHHAFRGGLVKHLLEMWKLYCCLKSSVVLFSDSQVLQGIIHHDLHKAYKTYYLVAPSPWKVEYAGEASDQLLSNNMKTLWLLNSHGIQLTMEDFHILGWSEGGWAEMKTSRRSPAATLVYCLDDLSANVGCHK